MGSREHTGRLGESSRGTLGTRIRSYVFFLPLIYLYTGIMGTLSLLSSFFDRDGRMQHWFARNWSRMILATAGVRVKLEGLDRVDPSRPAIYTANHLSALDIPVLYADLPVPFRILAKRNLFSYPFLGWHLTRSGQIAVDLKDARASLRSLNRASQTLHAGMPLVVFPEGGRSADGCLREFMGGAFYVAIKAQEPVVPVVIVGTNDLLPMNSFHLLPGRVELVFCDPIPTTGMSPRDMDKLSAQVRQVIADTYYARTHLKSAAAQPSPQLSSLEVNGSE